MYDSWWSIRVSALWVKQKILLIISNTMEYQLKKQAIAIAKHKLWLSKTLYAVNVTFEICKNKAEAYAKVAWLRVSYLIVNEMWYTILIRAQ